MSTHFLLCYLLLFPKLIENTLITENNVIEGLTCHRLAGLISCGVRLGKSDEMVHYNQDVLISPNTSFQMREANGHQFKWGGSDDWLERLSGLMAWFLLLQTPVPFPSIFP